MPQPRKYADRAAQQAAYRQRQALAQDALLLHKGLPSLPMIPTMPGHVRWQAMMIQAQTLLCAASEEMQSYYEDRSAAWQESEQAEALLSRLEQLQETVSQLQSIE